MGKLTVEAGVVVRRGPIPKRKFEVGDRIRTADGWKGKVIHVFEDAVTIAWSGDTCVLIGNPAAAIGTHLFEDCGGIIRLKKKGAD